MDFYLFFMVDFPLNVTIKVDIKGLTVGDFATVKKKADFLNISDISEIIRMLNEEVKIKKIPELNKNAIGF